jgi:hypothetical protein
MDRVESFRGLRFEQSLVRRIPQWLVPFVIVPAVFTFLWLVIPYDGLYWLLLVAVTGLAWMAGYGWRRAVSTLIGLLQRLEQL